MIYFSGQGKLYIDGIPVGTLTHFTVRLKKPSLLRRLRKWFERRLRRRPATA